MLSIFCLPSAFCLPVTWLVTVTDWLPACRWVQDHGDYDGELLKKFAWDLAVKLNEAGARPIHW